MYVLVDKKSGGVYAVKNDDKKRTVQMWEEKEDAERYYDLLQAEDFNDKLEVVEVNEELVVKNCVLNGYYYAIISQDELIIPPRDD